MEGSEISIHHAFYWQKCLITHQIKQDGEPGRESVKRKICSTQTLYVCGVFKCDDVWWLNTLHSRFCELISVNHALWLIYARRLYSYSVKSDLWCRVICVEGFTEDKSAWAALLQMDLVSIVETDEGRGRRGFLFSPQVSLYFDIFTALLSLFFVSPVHHVLPYTPPQVYSVVTTSFHILSLLINFVTSLWARVK